jgi:hypothetical protein
MKKFVLNVKILSIIFVLFSLFCKLKFYIFLILKDFVVQNSFNKKKMKVFNNFIFILINTSFASTQQYFTEDVFVPKDCVKIAKAGDHLLIEYTVVFENGTYGPSLTQPEQLYHV